MTPKQENATIAMLADAGIGYLNRIAELEKALAHEQSTASQCRIYLQNIAGMALAQFPELIHECDRERDPYELIRQAFLKIRYLLPKKEHEAGRPPEGVNPK